MGLLLENALSEELQSPHSHIPGAAASLSGSRSSSSPPPPAPSDVQTELSPAATDTDKMIAASIGAVLTSLTMTPFDVVKTRLQTQAQPVPGVSVRLPSTTSPWPPPIPSTSSAPPPPPSACCVPAPTRTTYFNMNATPTARTVERGSLLGRLDPRVARAALPATAGAHHHHFVVAGTDGAAALCLYPPLNAATSAAVPIPAPPSFPPSAASAPPPARHLTGFLDALSHILRAEGPAALWRGTAPALLMSVPGQVGYMVGYDALRRTTLRRTDPHNRAAQVAIPLVAGSVSRAAVAVILSPVELIRTRLQAQTRASPALSMGDLARQLRWSTAWRGLSSTLWRDVPFSGIYWAGYEGIKRGLTGGRGMGEQQAHRPQSPSGRGSASVGSAQGQSARGEFAIAFASGAGSGVIAATLTNPFDVIKTRRQAPSASPAGTGSGSVAVEEARTLALLRQVVRTEGWPALWSGLTPRLAKVGPACGLMIGCYEAISGWRGASRSRADGNGGETSELA